MNKNNWIDRVSSAVIAMVVVFGLGAACTKQQIHEKVLTYHGFEADDVKTWDPANAYDSISLDLVPSIYETLLQYSYLSEVYKLEPLLAAKMPVYSKDRKTITLSIKKGVLFQDDPCFKATQGKGRELKAQDFVYALKRLALPALQSQGWWILDAKVVGVNAFHDQLIKAAQSDLAKIFDQEVEGLRTLDDYTLQIKLIKPDPQFPDLLAISFTSPVAVEAVVAYGDEQGNLLDHPIGTGPFLLSKWERNHEIVLDRNPNFREEVYPSQVDAIYQKLGFAEDAGKRLPFLDRISLSVIKEPQPRWLNFMNGDADMIKLPKDNFKQAITDQVNLSPELIKKGIRLSIDTGGVIRYISFNMKDKLLGSNKYLRQALASAVDRDEWITVFTNGTGRKMVNAMPPGLRDRPKNQKIKYDLNLARAKELLQKAGYPNGQGLPAIRFDLRGASTTDRQLGDFIAQQFARIGVKTDVVPNTFPAYLGKAKQGNLQVSFGGWSLDYPDAENIYQLLYGPNKAPGPGDANYENPIFDKLFEKVEVMESGVKRAELIQQMDDLLQEDSPWALGYYEAAYDLAQPWLLNFRNSAIILNGYKYYKINQDLKKRYRSTEN